MGSLLEAARAYLSARRVPEARASAEFIMADVLAEGRCRVLLESGRRLDARERRRFWSLVRRRSLRRPLAYVLGHQDFMGLRLRAGPAALSPRPETEELLLAVSRLARGPRRILDIGTGGGCIAVVLSLRFPMARVVATDISARALALARQNAVFHGVSARIRFINEDLFAQPAGRIFDLVVSNPPYIPSGRLSRLAPEVRAEPRLALDGGGDGLDAVRAIVAAAPGRLRPGGLLALEIDGGQGRRVRRLMARAGLRETVILRDVRGLERIAMGKLA